MRLREVFHYRTRDMFPEEKRRLVFRINRSLAKKEEIISIRKESWGKQKRQTREKGTYTIPG